MNEKQQDDFKLGQLKRWGIERDGWMNDERQEYWLVESTSVGLMVLVLRAICGSGFDSNDTVQ